MKAAFRCDRGLVRTMNQDSVLFLDHPVGPVSALFAVADGMGGHKAGEVASAAMVGQIEELVKRSDAFPEKVRDYWEKTVNEACRAVYELSRTDVRYNNMGTTFVMAAFFDNRICIGNIGDSRAYGYKSSRELVQLSHDHSLVQELLDRGELTSAEAKDFPRRNIITRAVGVDPEPKADFFFLDARDYSRILLCSDGLHGLVEDWEMEVILNEEKEPEQAVERLKELALSRGGVDNISVIVAEPEGGQVC